MNYCKVLLFFVLISISLSVSAQKEKLKFHTMVLAGVTAGESHVSTAFQTVNGVSFYGYFFGAGIGIDYYEYKSLPLFFDARKFFGKRKNGFVYGNLGYNFPLNDKPGKEMSVNNSYDFSGGIYTDFGLGIKTKFIKSTSLLFSLGHSYKKLNSKVGTTICPFLGPCFVEYSKYEFDYGRIIFKAGLLF